ncbi:MAG: TonB-dependent receptor [Gammaproteobacteria bacterium]
MYIRKKNLLLLPLLFSVFIFSKNIEEVIVKGEFREKSISEEDSSISIISSETIKSKAIKHFQQLSYLVPNLNYAGSDSRARYFQIRGIGERSGYQGTPNSSVGFLIDDIDYSGQGGIATLFDVDQVEVFRGPQGSRTGANALAGLIYIKTKDPTDKFEGTSEITLGDYGTQNLGIAFGGPMKNEKLKYRLVLRTDYADGFRKNIFLNKSDTSKKDELTLRYKLNWDFNETIDINFLISKVDMDDPADIWTIDGSLNTLSDRPGMDSQETDSYGIKITKNFDNIDIQSFTSITKTDVIFSYDADWGNSESHFPYTYDYFSKTLRNRDTFSQEVRFLSKNKDLTEQDKLQWIFGIDISELEEKNITRDDGVYGDPSDQYSPYVSQSVVSRNYEAENLSLFGNIDYFLSENHKLAFGLRWENWDSKYNDSNQESFNPSDNMNGGKISLIKNNDNSNIYFSIARGYKQGGFNLGLDATDNSIKNSLIYDPEFLTNYEIGLSSNNNDSILNYSAVFFFSKREDQQVLISRQVDPTDPNTFSYLTQNAAEGENYGIEVSSEYFVRGNLNLFFNFGLLKTKIKNWESRIDLENRAQAHAPERTYSFGTNLDINNNLYLKIDVNGKSSFYYSDSHDNKSKSYQLVNLTLGYSKANFVTDVWIRNLFDEYYSTRGFYFGNEAPNFIDTLYRRQGDPKNIGISIRYDF